MHILRIENRGAKALFWQVKSNLSLLTTAF